MFFIIGLIKSTAFYGIVSLLVSLFCFHIPFSTLYYDAFHVTNLSSAFNAFMLWSPIVYLVMILLHFIICLIKRDADHYWGSAMGRFIAVVSNPWRGLVALNGANTLLGANDLYGLYCWFQIILHFVWAIALFVFIGFGFYNLII